MAKKAIIILADGFEEIEAITPIDIMRRAGIEVIIAGINRKEVTGARGITILADKKFDEAGDNFDACVLPGGMPGAANLASSEELKSFINKMNREGKVIAAICAAPAVVLAPMGILNNRSATCYPISEYALILGKTAKYEEESVVVDGNIITSQSAGTALLFALAIVAALAGKTASEKVKESIVAV